MNEKLTLHAEREKVESIIGAFLGALAGIKAISNRPQAAAMISLRILDQFSEVLYKGETRDRVQQFVEAYLPKYCQFGIYDLFKYSLDYNFSVERSSSAMENASVSDAKPVCEECKQLFPLFVYDLIEGVRTAVEALRKDEEKRQRALEWYETHEVPKISLSLYTEEQQSKILEYYTRRIKSRGYFANKSLQIGFNFSPFAENGYRINVCIDDGETGKEVTRIPLPILAGFLRLKKVEEVLEGDSMVNAEQ